MERLQESTVCHHHHNTDDNTKTSLTQIARCGWACESKTAQTYHKWAWKLLAIVNPWPKSCRKHMPYRPHIKPKTATILCERRRRAYSCTVMHQHNWVRFSELSDFDPILGKASSVQNCGYCMDHPVTKLPCRLHRITVSHRTRSWWMGIVSILRHHCKWYMMFWEQYAVMRDNLAFSLWHSTTWHKAHILYVPYNLHQCSLYSHITTFPVTSRTEITIRSVYNVPIYLYGSLAWRTYTLIRFPIKVCCVCFEACYVLTNRGMFSKYSSGIILHALI